LCKGLGNIGDVKMSFGIKMFSGIQEVLVLALMLVSVFALFYINISIMYKVGIAVIVFSVVFLMTLATQILRQQKESKQAAA
jgi:hypothetical protein